MGRTLGSALLFLCFSSVVIAQGTCRLTIRVLTANERTIDTAIHVDILSADGLLVTSTNMFGSNSSAIPLTSGKAYRLRISGTGVETLTTPNFDINPLETDHVETVHVKLAAQKEGEEAASGSATVSISEMNVPRRAAAEMKKGLDAYAKGEMESAGEHFRKAIALYPRYARAYDMLGAIAMKKDDRVDARNLFSKSIQVDGDFYPAYVDLARMDLQDRRYAESESLLTKAISLRPWMPAAIALLATAEFANGEFSRALPDVQRAHALPNHEEFAEIHAMAGRALLQENHPDDAIAQFQLFLKEKPGSAEAENIRREISSIQSRQHP